LQVAPLPRIPTSDRHAISSVFFPDAGDEDKKEERLDDLDEDELDNVSFTRISRYIAYIVS
jgi:hypothetical protein